MARKKLALHWWILIALGLGLVAGVGVNRLTLAGVLPTATESWVVGFVRSLNSFVADLFIRLLQFIAAPIVLFSLVAGAASLADIRKLSRIGTKTIVIYTSTTAVAISVGLVLANVIRPGSFVSAQTRDRLAAAGAEEAGRRIELAAAPNAWQTLLNIVPKNPFEALARGEMLQIVFAALAVGVALTLIPRERAGPVIAVCEGLTEAVTKIVHVVMLGAPVAVFCLISRVIGDLGLDVLGAVAVYAGTVVLGLAVVMYAEYPALLRAFTPVGYRRFFGAIAPAQLMAFSSSSSNATLPVTLDCAKNRLGAGEEVASFVVPLGATVNMDGTALYQGVATVFIAQLYGIELSLAEQLMIVLTATLASIGTAGIPGVGMVMLVIVLQSVGMTAEVIAGGIAVILGIDRVLDMCRTAVNVTGDCVTAAIVAHGEGELRSP
jgi:Na+/H+-dicarboxylate symporter